MYGSYEEPTTALLTKLAQKGWRFLDVGSNHGYYALLARDLGGSTARIVAFEPNPTVMRLLRRSVDLNGFENVEAVEAACSNESGFLNLYLSSDPHNSGTSTLSRELRAKGGLVRVRVITIDEYCAGGEFTPDVVKLDVEGHELHVLEGMRRILQDEPPRAIIAELTDDPRLRAHQGVPKFLAQFGYCPTVPNDDGSLRKLREIHEIQNVCYVLRGDPLLRAANIADE